MLHSFCVRKGCPPVQCKISLKTGAALFTLASNPASKGCASSKVNPGKSIAIPILNGVRFLSAIKSLGVATPNMAKVRRLYSGLMARWL